MTRRFLNGGCMDRFGIGNFINFVLYIVFPLAAIGAIYLVGLIIRILTCKK